MLAVLTSVAWLSLASASATASPVASVVDLPPSDPRCSSAEVLAEPRVFLITTSPGSELFSVFGHSALWVSGGRLARPVVLDWGNFASTQGLPVADFLRGSLRYTLEATSPEALIEQAQRRKRTAVAQRLDLPPQSSAELINDVVTALAAPDRSFQYDWLTDNCATRVRDILDGVTDSALSAATSAQTQATRGHSARQEVLRHLGAPQRGLRGAALWLGWHVLATGPADRPLSQAQSLFLPDRLMRGVQADSLIWPDGSHRPLVPYQCTLTAGDWDFPPQQPSSRGLPTLAFGLAWALSILIAWPRHTGAPNRLRRSSAFLGVAGLGTVTGLMAVLTLTLALTGDIQATHHNQSWWLLNPASLLLLPASVALARSRVRRWHVVTAWLLALSAIVGSLLSATHLVSQVLWPTPALLLPPLWATALLLSRVHNNSVRPADARRTPDCPPSRCRRRRPARGPAPRQASPAARRHGQGSA